MSCDARRLDEIVVLQFNDIDATEKQIRSHGDKLADIILGPVSKAFLAAEPEYIRKLRELATEHYGIVLIFDEVITGMRLGCSIFRCCFNILHTIHKGSCQMSSRYIEIGHDPQMKDGRI